MLRQPKLGAGGGRGRGAEQRGQGSGNGTKARMPGESDAASIPSQKQDTKKHRVFVSLFQQADALFFVFFFFFFSRLHQKPAPPPR